MSCIIVRNQNTNEIEQVNAPNGKESILYKSILALPSMDKEIALRAWAQVYTPQFKEWFGDWEAKRDYSKVIDENGEPLLVYPVLSEQLGSRKDAQFFLKQPVKGGLSLPVFLSMKTAATTDNKGESYLDTINSAKEDGVIIKNAKDPFNTDVYVVFDSFQIKSVFNNGSFSSSVSDINYNLVSGRDLSQDMMMKAEDDLSFRRGVANMEYTRAKSIENSINNSPKYSGLLAEVRAVDDGQRIKYKVELYRSNTKTDFVPEKTKTNEQSKQEINAILSRLLGKFENIEYKWISPDEINQQEHKVSASKINAFVKDGVIYLVEGRVTSDIALEEILHPFIELLSRTNRSLFLGLARETENLYKDIISDVVKTYKGFSDIDITKEIVTRGLQRALKAELTPIEKPNDAYNQLKYLLTRFLNWLDDIIQQVFSSNIGAYRLDPYKLPENTKLSSIASMINTRNASVMTAKTSDTYYNISEVQEEEEFFSAKNKNIERIEKQIIMIQDIIDNLFDKGNEEKIKTLNRISDNLRDLQDKLLENEITVSVTKLSGGGALDSFTASLKYQNFGNFAHDVLEEVQKEYNKSQTTLPSRILTESFINKMLSNQVYKRPEFRFNVAETGETDINGLDKSELINILKSVIQNYEPFIIKGYTIIPELTIGGIDRTNRVVIGRIDTLAVSPEGKVVIIDLKTKKVYDDEDWKNVHLQLSKRYTVEATSDSDPEFFLTPADSERNTYQNWDIQLTAYEQIFKQMGVDVEDRVIMGLLYMGKNTYSNLPDSLTNSVDWKYHNYMIIQHRSAVESYSNISDRILHEKYRNIMRMVIPTREKTTEEKKDTANIIFNLNEKQEKDLVKRINNIIDTEVSKTRSAINKYKDVTSDEETELIKSLKDRRETLMKIKDIMKREGWEVGYKMSLVIGYLKESYENFNKTVNDIKKEPDINKKALYLDAMRRRATGLNYFINELERTLISIDPVQNKAALDVIGDIKTNMQTIIVAYNELGADFMIDVLKSMRTEFGDARMNKQREEAIKPKIEYLKRKIESLKSTDPTIGKTFAKLKFWAMGNLSNKIKNLQGIPTEKLDLIKSLELQLKTLELELKGVQTDPDSLRKYIEGALENEKSLLYMGRNVTIVSDFIASASNSDFGISAFTNFLKKAQQDATREYVNFVEKTKFQKRLNDFAKGETDINKLSDRIQEVRTVKEETDTGFEDKEYLSLIDPITESYRNVFKEYYKNLREVSQKIRESEGLSEDEKKKLIEQKNKIVEQHRTWRLANSSMPLVKEVYELENLLPESYRNKRRELLEERDSILYRNGFNNEELLTEEDLLEVNEIEVEIQRLKLEVLKDNIDYKEYIEKLEKYYTYETNWNYFNRIMNSKKIQYGEDSQEFRKWLETNATKVPNDDYYEAIGDIYEEMFTILEADTEIKEIRDRQRELLNRVRNRGAADVRFLTADEKAEYMELEAIIQELRDSQPKADLDEYERRRLGELRLELGRLKTTTTNPYYQKDFFIRKQSLDQKYNLMKQAEEKLLDNPKDEDLKRNVKLLLDNFIAEEEEFAEWYVQNHSDQYESRLFTDKPLNPRPLKFNLVDIPVKPEHYDLKPINKFSIRKLKDAAKNKEYKEDVYGHPLPLSVKRDGVRISILDEKSQWVNPKFVEMTKRASDYEFYNFLTDNYLKTQLETYGNKLGYLIPGYEEEAIKNYQKLGVKEGAAKNFEVWSKKNFTFNSPYDYDINDMATDVERIRFKHNKPLDISEQSGNAIGSILKWFEEAYINKSVGVIQPLANSAISYMENLAEQLIDANVPDKELRKEELNKAISIMKYEYDKIIKGETKENQGSLGRIGDALMKGLGFTRMGFEFSNQIGNLFSGNVQIYLGSHKTGQYSTKNYLKAKKKMWGLTGLVPSLIRDVNKTSGKSFLTKMYMYFNPLQEGMGQSIDKTMSRNDRVKQSLHDLELAFWIQDKGELEIASTIWLAMMDNRLIKYTDESTGETKMVPVFEAYGENQNGEIIIKKGYDWTKKDEEEFFRNMYSEIRRTQGNYASIDKTKAEKGVFGRLLVYYRKYLMPNIQNRFASRRENHEGSEIAMGYYNALYQSVFQLYGFKKTFLSLFGRGDGVSDFYKQRNQWAAREMLVAVILTTLGNVLAGMVKSMGDDDDDESYIPTLAVYHMLNVYLKVERETRGLVPLPGIGGIEDYLTQLTNFTNVGTDIVKVMKILTHGIALGMAQVTDNETIEKSAYYQRKTGNFQAGEAKVVKDIMDVTGFMNVYDIFYPEERTEQAFKRR
jgi:hypothetical protein